MNNVESDEVEMEGSVQNSTIYSIINDEGILESVEQMTMTKLESPNTDNFEDMFNNDDYNNGKKEGINDTNQNLILVLKLVIYLLLELILLIVQIILQMIH